MSDIWVQRCTKHLLCEANKSVVELSCTYFSPVDVLQMWGSEKNIRCKQVMWREQLLKGAVDWFRYYEDSITVVGVEKSSCSTICAVGWNLSSAACFWRGCRVGTYSVAIWVSFFRTIEVTYVNCSAVLWRQCCKFCIKCTFRPKFLPVHRCRDRFVGPTAPVNRRYHTQNVSCQFALFQIAVMCTEIGYWFQILVLHQSIV